VELTFAIGAINVWNRLQVGFRAQPTMKKVQHAA
jgi:alkylhydroperoxidase family enzyme